MEAVRLEHNQGRNKARKGKWPLRSHLDHNSKGLACHLHLQRTFRGEVRKRVQGHPLQPDKYLMPAHHRQVCPPDLLYPPQRPTISLQTNPASLPTPSPYHHHHHYPPQHTLQTNNTDGTTASSTSCSARTKPSPRTVSP